MYSGRSNRLRNGWLSTDRRGSQGALSLATSGVGGSGDVIIFRRSNGAELGSVE